MKEIIFKGWIADLYKYLFKDLKFIQSAICLIYGMINLFVIIITIITIKYYGILFILVISFYFLYISLFRATGIYLMANFIMYVGIILELILFDNKIIFIYSGFTIYLYLLGYVVSNYLDSYVKLMKGGKENGTRKRINFE